MTRAYIQKKELLTPAEINQLLNQRNLSKLDLADHCGATLSTFLTYMDGKGEHIPYRLQPTIKDFFLKNMNGRPPANKKKAATNKPKPTSKTMNIIGKVTPEEIPPSGNRGITGAYQKMLDAVSTLAPGEVLKVENAYDSQGYHVRKKIKKHFSDDRYEVIVRKQGEKTFSYIHCKTEG